MVAAALALALGVSPSHAQRAPTATDVKAAYLLKFGAFVGWPAESGLTDTAPLVLCVVGRDPVGVVLDSLAKGATVGAHPISLRRLSKISADSGCHMAFLGGSREQSVVDGLRAVSTSPVLTVTDAERGESRGVIHFAVEQNRVRFYIDASAASRGSLSLSSKLLALAISVKS